MSFLTGKKPAAATPTQLNSINVDQSRYGDPVPLVYGVQRIPMTLLWYGAFSSTAQYSGGSGKGGKGPPSSYSYTASCVMGLCEGPIPAVKQVWKDKDLTTLANENLTLFLGSGGQAPWTYLSSNFPQQAVPYDHTAYVAEANLSLGNSAALPNYTFEVQGFLSLPGTAISFTGGIAANAYSTTVSGTSPVADGVWDVTFSDNESRTCTFLTTSGVTSVTWDSTLGLVNAVTASAIVGGYDAEPSAILVDYCTEPNHGAGFNNLNVSQIQTHTWASGGTTYTDSFKIYCEANGLLFSPWEDTQRAATDFVKDLLELGNSNSVMSAGNFNIVPYGDSPVSGNGVTYTPNLTPQFSFTDDDFMPNNQGTNSDPVVVTRKPLTDTYNVVRIEFLDRGNSYNVALAEWTDPLDIAVNGIRVMSNKTFHQICDARVANQVAAFIGQRQLYVRNTYQFTVRADYSILEPMDLVAITDANLGIYDLLVRITEIEDDQNDVFTITAEDCLIGTASAPKYNFQAAQGYAANFAVTPFSVATPLIFSAAPALVGANGGYEIWVAAASSGLTYAGSTSGDYGGADVYGSMDGTTYSYLGQINGLARYGTTAAAIGATDTSVNVTLLATSAAEGLQLTSASASDYANNRALVYVDGEIIGFETATLIGTGEYTLSPISRNLFGSPVEGHAAGASWARLDESIFKFAIDPGMVGQTINLKFCAFNSLGRNIQPLSEATAYPYVIETSNVQPGSLDYTGVGVTIDGTSAFKSALTTAWDSSLYSLGSYTNGCTVECYCTSTAASNALMLGLTLNPNASNSYTNLAFAWYMVAGNLNIYENGTYIGAFGTYVSTDLMSIVYDGKHVAYYHNATLVRSVPYTNGTFFAQVCFANPGNAIYGFDFNGRSSAVTPFTLIPMSNSVACAGTRVVSNALGTTGWGNKNFTSNESISGGCFVSASPSGSALGASFIGVSSAPATGASGGYGPVLAAWYLHSDGSACQILFNGAVVATISGAPATTDVLTITFDQFNFRFFKNSVLEFTQAAQDSGALYLFGDFYYSNSGFSNVSFAPFGPSTPAQFVSRGAAVVSDSLAIKEGGAVAWDSDICSIQSYSTCNLVWKANDTTHSFMGALVTPYPVAPGYVGLDYALYCASGTIGIYESGTSAGTFGTYTANDRFAITYDGATVTYSKNGTTLRTVSTSGQIFYADLAFYNPGAGANSIDWGPGAVVPILDTGQINNNAVSQIISATNAGDESTVVSTFSANPNSGVIATITINCTGNPVAIDAAAALTAYQGEPGYFTASIQRDGVALASGGTFTSAQWNTTETYPTQQITLVASDTPAPGTHTYTLLLTVTSSASPGTTTTFVYVGWRNSYIKAREIKK